MPAGTALRLVLLGAAAACLGGCLGSAVGVVTAPAAIVASTASGFGNRALGVSGPISDIDRIIAAHPDSANSAELRALRDRLIEQGITEHGGPPPAPTAADEFDRHARQPRRLRPDRVRLELPAATGTRSGPPQRVEPRPFANARTSGLPPEVRRWYTFPVAPMRITPFGQDRTASRDPERGGR